MERVVMDIYGREDGACLQLVKVGKNGKKRYWSIRRDGNEVETRAWLEGKEPKKTQKLFPDGGKTAAFFQKSVRSKMRSDYVYLREEKPESGSLLMMAYASGCGGGAILDVSLDGRYAITGGFRGAPTGVWLETIDTTTGRREKVFETAVENGQVFLHEACFDRTGKEVVLSLNEETLRLELETNQVTSLASYREFRTARFNPFVLRPHMNKGRSRIVVFDAGSVVRVLDEGYNTVLEVCVEHPERECRAAQLSPSGKLLGIYQESRRTNESDEEQTLLLDIWDVEKQRIQSTFRPKKKLSNIGFDQQDELLIMTREYYEGPFVYDISSQKKLHHLYEDSRRFTRSWDCSSDSILVLGESDISFFSMEEGVFLTDIKLEDTGSYGRVEKLLLLQDETRIACYEHGMFTLRQIRV